MPKPVAILCQKKKGGGAVGSQLVHKLKESVPPPPPVISFHMTRYQLSNSGGQIDLQYSHKPPFCPNDHPCMKSKNNIALYSKRLFQGWKNYPQKTDKSLNRDRSLPGNHEKCLKTQGIQKASQGSYESNDFRLKYAKCAFVCKQILFLLFDRLLWSICDIAVTRLSRWPE